LGVIFEILINKHNNSDELSLETAIGKQDTIINYIILHENAFSEILIYTFCFIVTLHDQM